MPPGFRLHAVLVAIAATGILFGFLAQWLDFAPAAWVWGAATVPVLLALLAEIIAHLRRGDVGLDIVAALSMTAALIFGEELAAIVVALMYAGGQYLEAFAEGRARREMTALLARAPRSTIRHDNGELHEIAVDLVRPGDRLLIRRGDVVPVDGTVAGGIVVLDQSTLTGESIPVRPAIGELVMSGATNVGEAFDLLASRRAKESTYAGIVRLVEAAQKSKAPMSRLADRYALVFLAMTLVLAAGAWAWAADPVRAVAVLVIATPCPLILAVPVAIVSGLSRAASHGILIKDGNALETMARTRVIVIDKTGTLTEGRARLVAVRCIGDMAADDVLRLAASLDQASKHIIAEAIVAAARDRQLPLALPMNVVETPGEGVEGDIDGRHVIVGGKRYVQALLPQPVSTGEPATYRAGTIEVSVATDDRVVGELILADELRTGTEVLLRDLREFGLERIVLATGDRRDVADTITSGLLIDSVRSELTPDQKVMVVLSERKYGPVMMVGDGVNDAPALAAADVGVAMGAKGAAASAEVADIVLLVDQLDRLVIALRLARRSRLIALESVWVGLGLSTAGMIAAAFGVITPVHGALLQEVIDVAVILNALRVLRVRLGRR